MIFYKKNRSEKFRLSVDDETAFSEVLVSQFGDFAAARGAHQVALLDEERFIDLFHGAGILAHRRGDGGEPDGTALELVDDGAEDAVVHLVEAVLVHIEGGEGDLGDGVVDGAVALDLGEVADTAQQQVGDTRGSAAASGNLVGRVVGDFDFYDARRPFQDFGQRCGIVVLEPQVDAEAGAERSREQAAAGGGPHERERVEGDLHAAGIRARLNHDVDFVVLHGGVEVLFHYWRKAVDLVNEKDIVGLEVGEQARQLARLVDDGAGGDAHVHAHLIGDDVREGGLAEAWRPVQQHMVEGLFPRLRRLHEHDDVLNHLLLPVEVAEVGRPDGALKLFFRS